VCSSWSNVKKGFFAGGVIDLKSEEWPDFYAIVNTCKKRNADKYLCLEEFATLYYHMEEHRHVLKTRADLLAKLIRQRLANHKCEKVDANKHGFLATFLAFQQLLCLQSREKQT
jgi:predicted N-acyltransferase